MWCWCAVTPRRAAHCGAEPRHIPQDDPEPLVGRRLQHRRHPVGSGGAGVGGDYPAPCVGRGVHVAQHDHRGYQCAVAAPGASMRPLHTTRVWKNTGDSCDHNAACGRHGHAARRQHAFTVQAMEWYSVPSRRASVTARCAVCAGFVRLAQGRAHWEERCGRVPATRWRACDSYQRPRPTSDCKVLSGRYAPITRFTGSADALRLEWTARIGSY